MTFGTAFGLPLSVRTLGREMEVSKISRSALAVVSFFVLLISVSVGNLLLIVLVVV